MADNKTITILISIDGLRADFDEFYGESVVPTLVALSKGGVRARHVIPQFNTLTLPNHVSIATGLYAENHGFVSNCMFDSEMDDCWTSWDHVTEAECHLNVGKATRWWQTGCRVPGAEPIWTANQQQGGVSGVFAWPLGELPFSGILPHYKSEVNCDNSTDMSLTERIDTVVGWVTRTDKPANFAAVYFPDLDQAEHVHGIKAPETIHVIGTIDSALADLKKKLEQAGVWSRVNLVITSDHGHVDIDFSKFVYVEDFVAKEFYVKKDPCFWPMNCSVEFLYEKLSKMPHVKVYTKEQLLAKSTTHRYANHWRIGPIVAIPDEAAFLLRARLGDDFVFPLKGMHGYDFDLPSMWPCFVATGPAFKQGLDLPAEQPIDQVDIAALCCETMGIKMPPSDSSIDRVRHIFK